MQKAKQSDGATIDGEFIDASLLTEQDGTNLLSKFMNDNWFNVFELVENAGYTLVDNDLTQLAKALRSPYNATYIYNTSAIATQTVSDVVLGSDGVYYEAQDDVVVGINPVGDLTGKWKPLPVVYREIVAVSIGVGTHSFDFSKGTSQEVTATGDFSFEFSNFISGVVQFFTIKAIDWGAWTQTPPVGLIGVDSILPILTVSGTDRLGIIKNENDTFEIYVIGLDIGVIP